MPRTTALIFTVVILASLVGCRQDMHNQPKFVPLRGSEFFADGRSARSQVAGTVARGQEQTDTYFLTGMNGGKEGDGFPLPVTLQVLARGQERFNIYCSPCHSRVGNGEGRIVERGYHQAANFHSERLREAPAGHFFNVITHGYGAMPDYHVELTPADRWAVVAYIRALQLSQDAKTADAPSGTNIGSLLKVASDQGLPSSFAQENWMQPRPVASFPGGASLAQAASLNAVDPQSQPGGSAPETGDKKPVSNKVPAAPKEKPGDAAAGKQIYTQNCQMCHQANLQGLPPAIPALKGIVAKVGTTHIRETVLNGVPTAKVPMPSFASKLSEGDINNLIAFLKTKP